MVQHSVPTPYMVGDVHFYTSDLDGGPVFFDCGPPLKEGREALAKAAELRELRHVFLTHCHIDHYGLCPWIERNSGATIWMPTKELKKFERRDEHERKAAELLDGLGFGPAFLDAMRESFRRTTVMPEDFSRYRPIEESALPPVWGLDWIACPGHSQSDIVWLQGDEAVTGDVLLRGIFQVPLLDLDLGSFEGRFRNYEAWCDSIPRIAALRGRRIRPGHRLTAEVDEALVEYVTTLLQRARLVKRYRHLPMTSIVDEIFKGRLSDPFYVYLKVSEIVFMIDFLDDPDSLRAALVAAGLFDGLAELFAEAIRPA
ncbi:MAG TPA: MBL fold metallo-hydrolase [Rectinemataceae bacterium]|nr:MBL fold metallo-hydrolase [Rectinemataceae bacterium]